MFQANLKELCWGQNGEIVLDLRTCARNERNESLKHDSSFPHFTLEPITNFYILLYNNGS